MYQVVDLEKGATDIKIEEEDWHSTDPQIKSQVS